VIESGKNGLLTDLDDIDGLANAITELLTDKNRRMSMSAEAVETINSKFSFNSLLKKLENIYGRVSGLA